MADAPDANPGGMSPHSSSDFIEAPNYDLVPNNDESEAELAGNPEAFLQWCQFPGDQTDSPQVTTEFRSDHLQIVDQPFYDSDVLNCYLPQHEPEMIFPKSGAVPAHTLSPNAFASSTEEPWNRCEYALDSAKALHPAQNTMYSEGSASDTLWTPLSIGSRTLKQQITEQEIVLKKRQLDTEGGEPCPPKRQKSVAHDRPNKDQVGTIEASFFEYWLSNFPDVYPGPKQFNLLAGLTQVRTEIVQTWFTKRLRNGPQFIVAADISFKSYTTAETPNSGVPQMKFIQPSSDQPVQESLDLSLAKLKVEASNWTREHKVKKCCKTLNPVNFVRDSEKPYCCTEGCGAKFKNKDDWRKHEETNYPQGGWICNVGAVVQFDGDTLCAFCRIPNPKTEHTHRKALCSDKELKAKGRLHYRKQHFSQHFTKVHPGVPFEKFLQSNYFTVKSKFPRRCGFCWYLFEDWRNRIEHIGDHFFAGEDMSQWNFEVEIDDEDSGDNEGFSRKRSNRPDSESDSSEDDRNDSPPKLAPKRRRQNTQHTYIGRACSRIQSGGFSSANDIERTDHIHRGSHGVLLDESFPEFYLQCPESEKTGCMPSSITTTIIPSTTSKKLTQIIFTKAFLKSLRPQISETCRLSAVRTEVKLIEGLRYRHMSQLLRVCEYSVSIYIWTSLPAQNGLAVLVQYYADTLIPSSEAIDRWSKLFVPGNINYSTHTVISITKYAPKVGWNADICSLASLILGIWRLLVDDDKATFGSLLKELFSSSALCHENYAQFQEWISLQRKNGNAVRTRMACRALDTFNVVLTVRLKDPLVAYGFPNHLYYSIHLQPIEKPLMLVVRNQHNAYEINTNATSEIFMDSRRGSAFGIRHTSEVSICQTGISEDDPPTSLINLITQDAGNAFLTSTQRAVPDDKFCEMPTSSVFSSRNNLSSSFSAETHNHAIGAQHEFYSSRIGSSFLSRHLPIDCDNPTVNKLPHPACIVDYTLLHKPLAGTRSLRTLLPKMTTDDRGKGRRSGPLSIEARKQAALVRRKRSCFQCWLSHIKCDTNNICTNCARTAGSRMNDSICFRGRLSDYTNLFLPDAITSKYSERSIQIAISCQIVGFTDNQIEVLISTKPTHPPLPITVYEYIPLSSQFLQLHHVSLVELGDLSAQNTYLDAPPLALWNYDPEEIKDMLSTHVKARIKASQDIDDTINDETCIVSYKMFKAVNKYRHANDSCEENSILELALEIHTMNYIMNHVIIIKSSSALQAFAKLQRPHVRTYSKKFFSPEIINLQLKHELLVLLREATAAVLRGFEGILLNTARGKHTTWSTAFCIMIVLSLCIETVQIAVDAIIIAKMANAEVATANTSRAKHYQDFERPCFYYLQNLFMSKYRGHGLGRHNFIRDVLELNEGNSNTSSMVNLAQDVRRIMEEHMDEINERAKDPVFEAQPSKLREDHLRFRNQMSGRMVSKFLKEFC